MSKMASLDKDGDLITAEATGFQAWKTRVHISQGRGIKFWKEPIQPIDEMIIIGEGAMAEGDAVHYQQGEGGANGILVPVPNYSPMFARFLRAKRYLPGAKPVPIIRSIGDFHTAREANKMVKMRAFSKADLVNVETAYDSQLSMGLTLKLKGVEQELHARIEEEPNALDRATRLAEDREDWKKDATSTENDSYASMRKWLGTRTGQLVLFIGGPATAITLFVLFKLGWL